MCPHCRTFWDVTGPAACSEPDHLSEHAEHELHVHREAVALPDGTTVWAATFDERDPYRRAQPPDYGLYLDERWQPPWPHDHLAWPDFGVPSDPAVVTQALRRVLDRARTGDRVEIGCWGAHGRTGTALAALAVLAGLPSAEAVPWVRTAYCPNAVETAEQEAFVARLAGAAG